MFTIGVFLKPITEDLGMGRGVFSSALTLRASVTALACPLLGWLIDRWGARHVMIPGLLLYTGALAGYGLIPASPLFVTYLIFAAAGVFSAYQTPIAYASVTA